MVPWVEMYRKRLNAHPAGPRPVDPKAWREALGVQGRVGDWIVFFRRELAERPWKTVLAEWTARLSPGVVAAAFHGAIRTAHAVRSLEAAETPARVRELAEGLGYWAATYNALPEATPPARPAPRAPALATRSRAFRAFRPGGASRTATSPSASRRSTAFRPSRRWPTPSTLRAIRARFSRT